jgi:S1-C subfamily serine protease
MQSTTQPSDEGPDGNVLVAPVPPRLAVTPRPDGGIELGSFSAGGMPYDAQVPSIALKVIGVLVDAQGHVLVPLYIEPGAIGSEPLRVTTGDGKASTATFVGSDRQTNLTIFKLNSPVGRPVAIDGGRPADGSLVMVLSPAGDSGRLTVWTGGQQDRGIIVTMDGGVAGFARYGQFLNGAYSKPVIDQLIKFGKVRRATLGVIVEETETPDGQRGMRIDRVMAGSPAEKVGLQPNDYILAMAGTPVGDLPSFAAAIASRDGDTELQIMRGDRVFKVSVVLKPK